ncbi:MAG: methyltransferase domain-containing protein, partial [Vicinamibacterales bacterium]
EHDPPIFLTDGNTDSCLDVSAAACARAKLAWVADHAPRGAALLDVGANFGHFVREAASMYDAVGIEPSATGVAWARAHLGTSLELGTIDDERPDFVHRFAAVTMFDVIEHVPDAGRALARVRQCLAPGGRLFITTPDTGSLVARALGGRWYHYDLVQHVALFNRRNLTQLLQQVGFAVRAARTFGRTYRLSYIEERLRHMGATSAFWRAVHAAAVPLRLAPHGRVPLNLGDVMGLVAEVRS